jgi:hypothetical protein
MYPLLGGINILASLCLGGGGTSRSISLLLASKEKTGWGYKYVG